MIPLVGDKKELKFVKAVVDDTAKQVMDEKKIYINYHAVSYTHLDVYKRQD